MATGAFHFFEMIGGGNINRSFLFENFGRFKFFLIKGMIFALVIVGPSFEPSRRNDVVLLADHVVCNFGVRNQFSYVLEWNIFFFDERKSFLIRIPQKTGFF